MEKMKVFTIENGTVTEGARVETFTLQGAGVSIPAILIGEEGRGRRLGILPVQLLPKNYTEWQESGYTHIHSAEIRTTKAGKPKLFQTEDADTTEECVCIFRTMIGFKGGNSHTGDRKNEYWVPNWLGQSKLSALSLELKEKYTKEEAIQVAEELNSSLDALFKKEIEFHPFPGEILCEGIIAQGAAGRVGSGYQYVAVMPANIVFRTGYSGRLYGSPSADYYIFRDGRILAATWEEREISDIF